jgi:hypothetical protein
MTAWKVIHWKGAYWCWLGLIDGVWTSPDGHPIPQYILDTGRFVRAPYAYS